jgi:proline iminopeptidase
MRSTDNFDRLHPPITPFARHRIDTGDGHSLYVEECGNPNGIPVVFLHGGPGSGISAMHRRMFDPARFRAVLFDQRGSGQSRPFASVMNNTTDDLVADMERIRTQLGIEKWFVFGGSWGATLALVYGIRHAGQCLGFILRGVFMGTKAEIDWFLYDMKRFYPEAWQRFANFIPKEERHDLLVAYTSRLMSDDENIAMAAAESWSAYENSCATLKAEMRGGGGRMALSLARMEAHYFCHDCFLPDHYISNHIDRLNGIPAAIIQGRHDVICPPFSAYMLAERWKSADITLVDDAGHSAFEAGILSQLLAGLERISRLV